MIKINCFFFVHFQQMTKKKRGKNVLLLNIIMNDAKKENYINEVEEEMSKPHLKANDSQQMESENKKTKSFK